MSLKSRWGSWKKPILIVLLLLVVLFGTVGVLWASNLFGWRAWRIQEVEGFIGATLPSDATDVHFFTQNQKTRIVWLRFSLPASDDLSSFVKQIGISATLRSGFTPFPAPNPQEAGLAWWDASTASSYSGLYEDTGQKIIEILLDTGRHLAFVRAYNIAA